jgi:hypothetical protein
MTGNSGSEELHDAAVVRRAMNKIGLGFVMVVAMLAIYAGYVQLANGGNMPDLPQDGYGNLRR